MAGKCDEKMNAMRQAAEVAGASVTSLRIWLANDKESQTLS
jgi:hypothetical protein